jgi:hypothetical protein
MIAVVPVLVQTVQRLALPVVQQAAMPRQPMAVTSLLKPVELKPLNPPLSAYAQSPRQLQQLTAKENNHVATRSSQIPQRAEGP